MSDADESPAEAGGANSNPAEAGGAVKEETA